MTDQQPSTVARDVSVSVFDTTFDVKVAGKTIKVYAGSVEIGIFFPMGVRSLYFTFHPVDTEEDGGKVIKGVKTDIAPTVTVEPKQQGDSPDSFRFTKHVTAGLHPTLYSFDIFVSALAEVGATLSGTFKDATDTEYQWRGECKNVISVKVQTETPAMAKPAGATGTPEELVSMTAILTKGDGKKFHRGDDMAEFHAETMIVKMMQHAHTEQTKRELVPTPDSLDSFENRVLEEHRPFLHKMAIHDPSEQIRRSEMVSKDVRNRIVANKTSTYLAALTSSGPYKKREDDPVFKYGWSSYDDKDFKDAQSEFAIIQRKCYQQGFRKACPEWDRYEKFPLYWYHALKDHLTSQRHLTTWLVKALRSPTIQEKSEDGKGGSQDKSTDPVLQSTTSDILAWGMKLTMLKEAAGKDGESLNPGAVLETLSGAALDAAQQQQVVDDEFIKQLKALIEAIKRDTQQNPNVDRVIKEKNRIIIMQLMSGLEYFETVVPGGTRYSQFRGWLAARNGNVPNGLAVRVGDVRSMELSGVTSQAQRAPLVEKVSSEESIASLVERLDESYGDIVAHTYRDDTARRLLLGAEYEVEEKLTQHIFSDLKEVGPEPHVQPPHGVPPVEPGIAPLTRRQKAWNILKSTAKGLLITLRVVGFGAMVYLLAKGEGLTSYDYALMGIAAGSEGIRGISFTVNKALLRWCHGYAAGRLQHWITGVKQAGQVVTTKWRIINLPNMLRLAAVAAGIVFCFKYWDEWHTTTNEDQKTYAQVMFGISVAETILLSVELLAICMEWTAAAAWAGPLAFAVGMGGMIFMFVWWEIHKPDPEADIKRFLEDEPKKLHLYN